MNSECSASRNNFSFVLFVKQVSLVRSQTCDATASHVFLVDCMRVLLMLRGFCVCECAFACTPASVLTVIVCVRGHRSRGAGVCVCVSCHARRAGVCACALAFTCEHQGALEWSVLCSLSQIMGTYGRSKNVTPTRTGTRTHTDTLGVVYKPHLHYLWVCMYEYEWVDETEFG